ncbi:MAG: leucyl aminopeptidase family protein [Alphaproteobacteria bacterium]
MTQINKMFSGTKSKTDLKIKIVEKVPSQDKAWAKTNNFNAKSGEVLITTKNEVLIGAGELNDPFFYAGICEKLPSGNYQAPKLNKDQTFNLVLGWALAQYNFDNYKKSKSNVKKLIIGDSKEKKQAVSVAQGIFITRDMINTPANDMTPADIEAQVLKIAKQFKAKTKVVKGKALEKDFPLIHTVGQASINTPRLIELNWGNDKHPTLHLIGKGISFDSGGLDIKPSGAMLTMKKDMGGAGNIIGLAYIIMANKLPVKLKVLIPSAENMVSNNSYRPMDILKSRKGTTIEVGNTDAEGRLVLADALTYASEGKKPADLTIDMATLTGAARVAVGADMPAFFCDDEKVADKYYKASVKVNDPVWRMPLHKPYRKLLNSPNADINSTGSGGLGGAITAGLFLGEFAETRTPWIHIDLMAYNASKSAGRPVGGEAMGIRALWELLQDRYN